MGNINQMNEYRIFLHLFVFVHHKGNDIIMPEEEGQEAGYRSASTVLGVFVDTGPEGDVK